MSVVKWIACKYEKNLGFKACHDYFTCFEPSQSVGGVKTGDPREKPPDHQQAELGLSDMWPELGSNPQRWDSKLTSPLPLDHGGRQY